MGKIKLRPAQGGDVDMLFEWANDPDVRENSLFTKRIKRSEHAEWFGSVLNSEVVRVFVVTWEAVPVGVVRLTNLDNARAVVSITIAPGWRGKHIGRDTLLVLKDEAESHGFSMLEAHIKPSNVASMRAFTSAGFAMSTESEDIWTLHCRLPSSEPGP